MHLYSLIINSGASKPRYSYIYKNTADISLFVKKQGVTIEKALSKDYSGTLSGSHVEYLFREGIKKAALIHLLKYSKPLRIKNIQLQIDKHDIPIEEERYRLFSLIESDLLNPVPKHWSDTLLINTLIQKVKTYAGPEEAAVYGYLLSRSKNNETDKFLNNWIAFNGFYLALYNRGKRKEGKVDERAELSCLIKRYGLGEEALSRDIRNSIGNRVMTKLLSCKSLTKHSLESRRYPEFNDYIESLLEQGYKDGKPIKLSIYGFMLVDFSYYLRCTLFHANKPMHLFSYAYDKELKALKTANNLLSDFLDSHLHQLFDGTLEK